MENLFVTSTEYIKSQIKGTFISISKNNYIFYIETSFIDI